MRVRDARQTFLGWWIRRAIEGKEIEVYGNGRQLRDFNYVDDVVHALVLAAASPEADGHIFNLGHRGPVALRELAAILTRLNGDGRTRIVPFPPQLKAIDIGDYYGDFSMINKVLGWEPRVDLEDGLKRTLQFFREESRFYW
jgi:nucleoside-diphosphate-sugar epimerase